VFEEEEKTYNSDRPNEDPRRLRIIAHDLGDEVRREPDDGDERASLDYAGEEECRS
jgi:hypothetical protein